MLLLHTCCTVCYLNFFENSKKELKLNEEEISLYFNNPNIHPRSEWLERLRALKKIAAQKNNKLIIQNYRPKNYFEKLKNLDQKLLLNKNTRCPHCWTLRLEQTFKYAKENNFKIVSTTLLVSQHQDKNKIISIGQKLAQKYKLKFFVPQSQHRCEGLCGFYKQNYCGCVYSLREKLEEKYFSPNERHH